MDKRERDRRDRAYGEGTEAARQGEGLLDCPYAGGGPRSKRHFWLDGFRAEAAKAPKANPPPSRPKKAPDSPREAGNPRPVTFTGLVAAYVLRVLDHMSKGKGLPV